MVQPGMQLLGDRYQLDSLIASGGMGQVWRGRDLRLGRTVAIKVLRGEYTGDPAFLSRFRAEATHAARLSHPHIAAVYDYGEVAAGDSGEQLAYLVMELVEGEPLSARLREHGPLSPEETLSVLRQTAEALAEAHHAGLVHRDVKPGNILVRPDDTVKITDFGIAWSAGSAPLTEAGQVLGTPQYLSPEQAVGRPPSPASDVYSLGLVGYECLTGHPAFAGDNAVTIALKQVHQHPEPLPAQLPAGIRELVDGAVAKDPQQRIPDADAFVAAIDRVRRGQPPTGTGTRTIARAAVPAVPDPAGTRRGARPGSPPGSRPSGRATAPGGRRGRLRAVLPAVVALLVGVGLAVLLLRPSGGADTPVAAPEQTQQSSPIVLDDADYVGRPVEDVAVELASLGLTVDQQREVVPGFAPGDVTELSPVGEDLQVGDPVTVFFAGAAPVAPSTGDPGSRPGTAAANRSGGGADASSAAPRPDPATSGAPDPTTDPVTSPGTTTDSSAPGTGSGEPSTSPSVTSSSGPESSGPESSSPESSAPESSAPESSSPSSAPPSSSGEPPSSSEEPAPTSSDEPPTGSDSSAPGTSSSAESSASSSVPGSSAPSTG